MTERLPAVEQIPRYTKMLVVPWRGAIQYIRYTTAAAARPA
jgi:hypothetical protein